MIAGIIALVLVGAAVGEGPPASRAGVGASGGVERLSDAQLIGQRIVVGFTGRRPSDDLERRIRRGRIAGVVLFSGNIDSRGQARRLTRALQSIPRPEPLSAPLLVMADQEGGLVKRLPGPPTMSAEEMGRAGKATCGRQGKATGLSLAGVGVNVNLAPVLDVARPGSAMAREDRAFGGSVGRVAACGDEFARALEQPTVAVTAKHFPGIGTARVNTDFEVQRLRISKRKLRRDEAPFESFAAHGGPPRLVMVSSAIYPAFSSRPASFTRQIATKELRGRVGFDGVSVSDALDTASADHFGGTADVARSVARAGVDLLLYTRAADGARATRALRGSLRRDELARAGFVASAERVLALRRSLDK